MKLSELKIGQHAVIRSVEADGSMRRRLQDIGFVRGAEIVCVLRSPLGDPTAFYINGALMALRESESRRIDVCDSATP